MSWWGQWDSFVVTAVGGDLMLRFHHGVGNGKESLMVYHG